MLSKPQGPLRCLAQHDNCTQFMLHEGRVEAHICPDQLSQIDSPFTISLTIRTHEITRSQLRDL